MNDWFALAPTHHAAMRFEHNTQVLRKVATLIGVPFQTLSTTNPP
jgi:L-arabinose isomerase